MFFLQIPLGSCLILVWLGPLGVEAVAAMLGILIAKPRYRDVFRDSRDQRDNNQRIAVVSFEG